MFGKEVPTGVKVISILYYIGAAIALLGGIFFLAGARKFSSLLPGIGLLGSGLFIVTAIIMIAFAILSFFIGRGLWKAQKWARILAIIFAVFGLINAIIVLFGGGLFSGIVGLIIHGLIAWYLWFNADVKQVFA